MSGISWKNDGGYGIFGYVEGNSMNTFSIYNPGDPCSNSDDMFELRSYVNDNMYPERSYHTNLEAAKRAARRAYRKRWPVVKVKTLTWDAGDHVCFGNNSNGVGAWFVADDYRGSGHRFVAETAGSALHMKVFDTMQQAKDYCEMMESKLK